MHFRQVAGFTDPRSSTTTGGSVSLAIRPPLAFDQRRPHSASVLKRSFWMWTLGGGFVTPRKVSPSA